MKYLITLLLSVLSVLAYGQDSTETKKTTNNIWNKLALNGSNGIKLSVGNYYHLFTDIAYFKSSLGRYDNERGSAPELVNHNVFCGVETSIIYKKLFIAPKIGYEVNLAIISARISLVNYTSSYYKSKVDSRILLEPGITIIGFVNLHYGYSIPITKTFFEPIRRNRITASINLL